MKAKLASFITIGRVAHSVFAKLERALVSLLPAKMRRLAH